MRLLVREVVSSLEAELTAKNLESSVECDPALPPALMVDEVRLRQILFNLLGNAVKFTDRGKAELKVSTVNERAGAVGLCIQIRDSGPGITQDDQLRIFEPFTQGASTKKQQGAGLGLAITKQLVERMGGSVAVESSLGQGATFTVVLPELSAAARVPSSLSLRALSVHEDQRALPALEVEVLLPLVQGTLAAMRRACGQLIRTDLLGPFADTLCESPAGRLQALGSRLRDAIGRFDVEAMRATLSEYDRLVDTLEGRKPR